jgi:L-lactate dehydrogenase complex protein LldG
MPMTDNRTTILASIRRSLGVTGAEAPRRAAVAERLTRHPRNTVPARGQLPPAERLELFIAQLEAAAATVERVVTAADVPAAIAGLLRATNLPMRVRHGQDDRLTTLPWGSVPTLEVRLGPSDGSDLVAVSHALAGVAETGTLALVSGADNPTTLNFLPDTHVVMVDAKDVTGDYETVWDRIRERYGAETMPRTVNFITGPSRSADIEQTLILGAHGPRKLHVIVVGG